MTAPRPAPDAARTRRAVNAVLDLEADGQLHRARALAAAARAEDPAFDALLRDTRAAAASLTLLPASPDFSDTILAAVDAQVPYVPVPTRRHISASRIAVAVGALSAFTLAVVMQRLAPPPAEPVGPVSELVEAGRADFTGSMRSLTAAFGRMQSEVLPAPAGPRGRAPALLPLAAGEYDTPLTAAPLAVPVSTPGRLVVVVGPVDQAIMASSTHSGGMRRAGVASSGWDQGVWLISPGDVARVTLPATPLQPAMPVDHVHAGTLREGPR